MLFRHSIFCAAVLVSTAICADEPARGPVLPKPSAKQLANPAKQTGEQFVATLNFFDGEVDKIDTSRIVIRRISRNFQENNERRAFRLKDLRVFRESEVDDELLKFSDGKTLKSGDKLKFAKTGTSFVVMIPDGPKPQPEEVLPEPEIDEDGKIVHRIPKLDEVKKVLNIESGPLKTQFALLSTDDRNEILSLAANVSGFKDAPPLTTAKELFRTNVFVFFNQKNVEKWAVEFAEKDKVSEVLSFLKVGKEQERAIKLYYSRMELRDRETARKLAKKVAALGLLDKDEKSFVSWHRILFTDQKR